MSLRLCAAVALAGLLAACASETVYMRNMAGMTVQCGPYGTARSALLRSLRSCIADFQRQGYDRVATP